MSNLGQPHFSLSIWLLVFKKSEVLKNYVREEKKKQRAIAFPLDPEHLLNLSLLQISLNMLAWLS